MAEFEQLALFLWYPQVGFSWARRSIKAATAPRRVDGRDGVDTSISWRPSDDAAGQRSLKVMANALITGFQRIVHRVRPVPVGSRLRVTR